MFGLVPLGFGLMIIFAGGIWLLFNVVKKRPILPPIILSLLAVLIFVFAAVVVPLLETGGDRQQDLIFETALDEKAWTDAKQQNSVESYTHYIEQYPFGIYSEQAEAALDEITWLSAVGDNTLQGYQQYLENYPDGFYAETARNKIENIAAEPGKYTTEEIEYFLEIALGTEFGTSEPLIRKWEEPIYIEIFGEPTPADLPTLDHIISELNLLLDGAIHLGVVNSGGNFKIYFGPETTFSDYLDTYQPVNYGFFWVWWNNNVINYAVMLIASEGITQQERSHLIREELTQSLGLMQDSWLYTESIFYQSWTDTTEYLPIDRAIIKMLYSPQIKPGMNRKDVLRVFE